jgi:hypothetical protein
MVIAWSRKMHERKVYILSFSDVISFIIPNLSFIDRPITHLSIQIGIELKKYFTRNFLLNL